MKWVVLAIVLSLAGYTYFTLEYRKDNLPAVPYEDARERFVTSRLRAAGYSRIAVEASRPADPGNTLAGIPRPLATIAGAPAGLPPELAETFAGTPKLPDSFQNVAAPASIPALFPYPVQYVCELPDHSDVLGETRVYVKNNHIAIVTDFERIDSDLLARTKDATVLLQLPAHIFRAGETFEITLIGKSASKHWSLQVR